MFADLIATKRLMSGGVARNPGDKFRAKMQDALTFVKTGRAEWLREHIESKTNSVISERETVKLMRQEADMAGTAKMQGAHSRLEDLLNRAEQALDVAFARLERATEDTARHAHTIAGIAETVEHSNAALGDKLNQMTNGGPPGPLPGEPTS